MTVRERLFGPTDIYEGLVPLVEDVSGWWNHAAMFTRLAKDAKLIVEIGSWKGASAIQLCHAAPQAEVVCIDTWLGAIEMWGDHSDATRYGSLALKNGYPQLYYQFLSNIVSQGLEKHVTPMPMPSRQALKLLGAWGVKPDLIYIDGSHEYEDVRDDISGAILLKPKIICGDDLGWADVRRAVEEQFDTDRYEAAGEFWWCEFLRVEQR